MAWSGMACAVGFGGINITSSLGQPLVAEIDLVAVERADKSSLVAKLASPDAFKGAGIDFPYGLPKLKFRVDTRANGDLFIKATSDQPVNEPFVSLLIELNWSSGRLLREYTFLLDPPGFIAEQPTVAAVQPIEPVVVAPIVAAPPVVSSEPVVAPVVPPTQAPVAAVAPSLAVEPAPVSNAEEPKQAESVAQVESAPVEEAPVVAPLRETELGPVAVSPITVKRGDTLSKLAKQSKPSDVSLERMLVALYRANAEAFDGKNMNRLRTGKILRLPESDELAKLEQSEAVKEIHAQVADWNAYRQKLAATNIPVVEERAKQEVAGKISMAIADKAPVAKEAAKEVLKLSKGDAAGDSASAGGKAKTSQDKVNAKEEEAIAKTKALKEAEQRAAMLEKSVKDMQRLVELKTQAENAKALPAVSAVTAPIAVSAVVMSSAVSAASEVVVAKPKVVVVPKVEPAPTSFVDEVLENPIYLGAGAAVLLALGGLGFVAVRRRKTVAQAPAAVADEVGGGTGRIAAPVAPSPETGDFTNPGATAVISPVDVDEVDPIGEADLFLNFGRDVQAEEVLKEALNKDPANNPVKLKLLSIYATRKDTKSFYVYALEVRESGDEASWSQAAAMGRELEPGNAVYGGGSEQVGMPEPTQEAALPAVDFDLGFGSAEPEVPSKAIESPISSDVAESEKTLIMSASELRAAQEEPMDFDVTGTHPGVTSTPKADAQVDESADAVDFDLTGAQVVVDAIPTEQPKTDGIASMDFDVTGMQPNSQSEPIEEPKFEIPAMDFNVATPQASVAAVVPDVVADPAPALNLDDLVFDVTSTHQTVTAPAPVADVDAGMAFTIDFPMEVEAKPELSMPQPKDSGLGEISLDLGDISAPVVADSSEVKDEHWQEVATKLDLAKAYQEMGDQAGAREILEEVLTEGDAAQREMAESMLQQLS